MEVNLERLKEALKYDKETGVFKRLISTGSRAKVGDVAGSKRNDGYITIKLDKHRFYAHRLAWIFENGAQPFGLIDHINGNTSDNRICNLREASPSVNSQNMRHAMKSSETGFLGVSPNGSGFMARINKHGVTRYLGQFKTASDASSAYIKEKRMTHEGCTL